MPGSDGREAWIHCKWGAVSQNNDLNQLAPQMEQAAETLGKAPEKVVTDAGYFSLKDIEKVPGEIEVIMPSRKQAQEENKKTPIKPFGKEVFTYERERDVYLCPEGKEGTVKFFV